MPYRRLPNTDNARIKSLRTILDKKRNSLYTEISVDIIAAERVLRTFENAQSMYKESLAKQASENRKFQKYIKNAKLYISHFIQVLNLCIIRGEIKKQVKSSYNLDLDNYSVPDLSSNEAILQWGKNVVEGDQERQRSGGTPIYNPTIARVNVAYSQFKDAYFSQKTYQKQTARLLESLSSQRGDIDSLICDLWNQVEAMFADLPPVKRIEKCKEFGLIYYLRKNEKDESFQDDENN